MDYQKHYNNLIIRAKSRLLEGYVEKHHVIPKCIGGSDHLDNLVALTPEEHFLAHQLLCKIHPNNNKLLYAAKMMTISTNGHKRNNNKLFGWIKRRISLCPAITRKPRKKETKPRNRNYIMSTEQKLKISNSLKAKNRRHSDTTKNRIRESVIKTKSLQKELGFKRKPNTNKRRPHSSESRLKMSAAHLGVPKPQRRIDCPHCNKTGAINNMHRYHFDHCPKKVIQ